MKIIFLDIDGVLCVPRDWTYVEKVVLSNGHRVHLLNQDCINNLNKIINATGASIVISSAWRIDFWEPKDFEILKDYFKSQGVVGDLIDHTAYDPERIRGREIQAWLNDHSDTESFVILDDSDDMEHLMPKLIRTRFFDGLEEWHAIQAIAMLNGEP